MRAMKDSGVEWIGEIPANWGIRKAKYVFQNGNNGLKIGPFGSALRGKTLGEGPYVIYNQANLIKDDFSIRRHYISDNTYCQLSHYAISAGDILFSMMGTIGKCKIMPDGEMPGIMDSHLLKTKLNSQILPHYFEYVYDKDNSNIVFEQLVYNSNGTIMTGLNSTIIKNVFIPLPSISEQQHITDYLDDRCAKIDTLISQEQTVIKKLQEYKQSMITQVVTKGLDPDVPMKGSGVGWIGDIPADWQIIKLKYTSYIRARLGWRGLKADEYVDMGYIFLSAFNVANNRLDFSDVNYIDQFRYDESPEIKLAIGDVLLVKDGAGIGKVAYVKEMPQESTVNGSIALITAIDGLNGKFLYYYFLSSMFKAYINLLKDGMGVPHLFQHDLKEIQIPFPKRKTQKQIISFLDFRCSTIDATISKKQTLIDKLTEYKKSLIYEVVTGKKEV